jgi:hypothetical protein
MSDERHLADHETDLSTERGAAVIRKRTNKPPPNPYLSAATVDDLSPANRIAHDIVAERRDLLPSVERIMNAGLAEPATICALGLFRDSLQTPGDPNRDPRVAIAAVASVA